MHILVSCALYIHIYMYIYIYIPGFVWWSWYVPVVGASAVQLLPVPPPVQAEEVEGLEQGTDHVPAEHVPGEHANSRSYVFIYIYILAGNYLYKSGYIERVKLSLPPSTWVVKFSNKVKLSNWTLFQLRAFLCYCFHRHLGSNLSVGLKRNQAGLIRLTWQRSCWKWLMPWMVQWGLLECGMLDLWCVDVAWRWRSPETSDETSQDFLRSCRDWHEETVWRIRHAFA